jgi:hypothetical protein
MKLRNPDSKQKKKHIAADSGLMLGEEKRTERRTAMLQLRCLHLEWEDQQENEVMLDNLRIGKKAFPSTALRQQECDESDQTGTIS